MLNVLRNSLVPSFRQSPAGPARRASRLRCRRHRAASRGDLRNTAPGRRFRTAVSLSLARSNRAGISRCAHPIANVAAPGARAAPTGRKQPPAITACSSPTARSSARAICSWRQTPQAAQRTDRCNARRSRNSTAKRTGAMERSEALAPLWQSHSTVADSHRTPNWGHLLSRVLPDRQLRLPDRAPAV